MGQHCQTDHVTSSPWPLTLEVMALPVMRLFMLQQCTKFEVCRPSNSADMMHYALSISRPGDLDLWFFDFETGAQPTYQILFFSGTFHSRFMGQHLSYTPSRHWHLTLVVMALVGDTGLRTLYVYRIIDKRHDLQGCKVTWCIWRVLTDKSKRNVLQTPKWYEGCPPHGQ